VQVSPASFQEMAMEMVLSDDARVQVYIPQRCIYLRD
jgi:hypothetical protein